VTLPKTTRAPQAEPLEPPDRIITLFRDNPRVLLVDDQPDIVESLALILRGSGYSVHTAEDGVWALQVAETLRPDVMVVDLGMPRMDGFQLARRVRQQPWGNRTILIAVTGWGQAEDRRRARDAGFDHHLVKPVDPDAVIRLMEAWSTTSANLDASTPKNINQ
jgi:CheY-like chemotaxis protein